jgi:hypothetical protein
MLELLSLQTKGISDEANRSEIQMKTVERLRQDEVLLVEWRQKALQLGEELARVQANNSEIRVKSEAAKVASRLNNDVLEFNNSELSEHAKNINADLKYLNIVMIGKNAIIDKQV